MLEHELVIISYSIVTTISSTSKIPPLTSYSDFSFYSINTQTLSSVWLGLGYTCSKNHKLIHQSSLLVDALQDHDKSSH